MTIGEDLDAALAEFRGRLSAHSDSLSAAAVTFDRLNARLDAHNDRLDAHAERLTALEEAATGEPPPPPEPDPEPEPDPSLHDGVGYYLPTAFESKVTLPPGPVGCALDAQVITPPGNLDGDTIENYRIVIPEDYDKHWVARNGTLRNCTIINPHGVEVGNFAKACRTFSCVMLGVTGDAWKAGQDEEVWAVDCFAQMAPVAGSAKHYDGVQVFFNGEASLERVVVDWNRAGTVGHTTGAIFTHDEASLYCRDLTVLNPAGTQGLIELHGSGFHDVDRVHVWGDRGPNWQGHDGGEGWPTRLTDIANGTEILHFYNDVEGAVV